MVGRVNVNGYDKIVPESYVKCDSFIDIGLDICKEPNRDGVSRRQFGDALAMVCGIRGVYVGTPSDPAKRAGTVAWSTTANYNNGESRTFRTDDPGMAEHDRQRKFGGPIPLHDPLSRYKNIWYTGVFRQNKHERFIDFYDFSLYADNLVQPGSVVVSDASGSAYVVFTRVASGVARETVKDSPFGWHRVNVVPEASRGHRTEQVRCGFLFSGSCCKPLSSFHAALSNAGLGSL